MSDPHRDMAYCYGNKSAIDCQGCKRRDHPKTGEHWWMVAPVLRSDEKCKYKMTKPCATP